MKPIKAIAFCFLLAGCTSVYTPAPPPNLLIEMTQVGTDRSPSQSTSRGEMLYVTDRDWHDDTGQYGVDRSTSMAFGTVVIGVANMTDTGFATYAAGQAAPRSKPEYAVQSFAELGRFPGTPLAFSITDGVLSRDRPLQLAYQHKGAEFQAELTRQLAAQGTEDVVLYVHGFDNTFEEGAYNLFELWHYSGRSSVPVLFSWPTGKASLTSYLGDTQNGAFSTYHLKETLRLISATEAVNSISVIAHSHGASIVSTALRELLIETRGAVMSMRDTYRIDTLIMAAPDIDLGVMEQRLVAEAFGIGFGQINVYLNPDDNALGLAGWLFGDTRFGAMTPDEMSEESRAVFRGVKSVSFILVEDANKYDRHSYFRLHPGVLADIGVTLKTGARPGDEERPLEHLDLNFWQIDDRYLPKATKTGDYE